MDRFSLIFHEHATRLVCRRAAQLVVNPLVVEDEIVQNVSSELEDLIGQLVQPPPVIPGDRPAEKEAGQQ